MAHSAPFVGVDVGGTKVAVGVVVGGKVEKVVEEPTDKANAKALLDQIERLIKGLATGSKAVGVGVPSVVRFDQGLIRSSVNVPLADIPLRQVLGNRLGLPVYVDNDATCAALAEAYQGKEERPCGRLVMLTLGTGVGGGIVIEGLPYRGASGAAGELGHTVIAAPPALPAARDPFPRPGSLESLASGHALDRLAREVAATAPHSLLGREGAGGRPIDGHRLIEAAAAGDQAALAALDRYAYYVGLGVANVVNTFDPEVVALGGGVSAAGGLLLERVKEVAARFILPGVGGATEIRIARAGPQAGLIGAALLANLEWEQASAGKL